MKTILIVDDDTQARTMFHVALTRNGYWTIETDSGATGLRMAHLHLPDLILSDINTPGGNGSTLLRDIRQDPELRSRRVVLMTGRPDMVTPRKGMEETSQPGKGTEVEIAFPLPAGRHAAKTGG